MALSLRTFQHNVLSCVCDPISWGLGNTGIHGACGDTREKLETGPRKGPLATISGEKLQPRPGKFKARVSHVSQTHLFPGDKRPYSRGAWSPWWGEAGGRCSQLWVLGEQGMEIGNCQDSVSDVIAPPNLASLRERCSHTLSYHIPQGLPFTPLLLRWCFGLLYIISAGDEIFTPSSSPSVREQRLSFSDLICFSHSRKRYPPSWLGNGEHSESSQTKGVQSHWKFV